MLWNRPPYRRTDRQTNQRADRQTDGPIDRWTDGPKDGLMDGPTDGWMDGHTDGWAAIGTGGRTQKFKHRFENVFAMIFKCEDASNSQQTRASKMDHMTTMIFQAEIYVFCGFA